MRTQLTYKELTDLASEYFGDRRTNIVNSSDRRQSGCVLYDAFTFEFGLGYHGEFEGGMVIELGKFVATFFGRDISLNNDKGSILRSFARVDKYCRRRLPREYLKVYDHGAQRQNKTHCGDRTEYRMNKDEPNRRLGYGELTQLAAEFFGSRRSLTSNDSGTRSSTGVLYDAFVFRYGINEDDEFEGGIVVGRGDIVTRFFGRELSQNSDRDSVLENFELVDKYCRLRLPDRYLRVFDLTSRRR